MDNSIKNFDKDYLIHTPMSFILQSHSKESIESLQDENGWTITHYAVAEGDISKIKELIHFNFNFGINSHNNYVNPDYIQINDKKRNPDKFELLNKIPFNKNGFNAIDLCLFLYNQYIKLNKQNNNDFFYNNYLINYQNILNLLLTKNNVFNTTLRDNNGQSFFDYAFLLENVVIIEFLSKIDHEFKSLSKVDLNTAKKILEVLQIKNNEHQLQKIISVLNAKLLEKELKIKEKNTKDIKKI